MPEPAEFACDVFISYSSRDREWVRGELLPRIEQAGLKAFIDFRDFTPGALSIGECERGVVTCRKTLVVLSPNYIASEWTEIEAAMVQTLTPANRKLRLIPLLKQDCEKPLRIGALSHIDFTDGADLALAWRQLLSALGAPPEPDAPREPERGEWFLAHPYPMPPNFTGRVAERAMLDCWLSADGAHPLLSLRALGGFGKSALVWHWLMHDVLPAAWPRVVWWSFYEGDASFDRFLVETLGYLSGGGSDAGKIAGKAAVHALVQKLHASGTLLVLDGFERVLRAFGGLDAAYQGDEEKSEGGSGKSEGSERDCISPLAEAFLHHVALQPQLRSKVLLTTRLCPRVLEAKGGGLLHGAREEPLRQMQPADAVAFFHAQGIRSTHTEIEAACAPYGYHPLSLRLLAGLIVGDFAQPGDIAASKRLDVSGDLVQRQHHVLETAYESLAPARRELLGRIACFRSPVSHGTLQALEQGGAISNRPGAFEKRPSLDADLRDLIARGLLHHDPKEGRFDLHPIVRRYAYDRLAAPDRDAAHARLRDYFAAVPPVEKVTRLEHLAPVIELYHHTVRAGQLNEACYLYHARLNNAAYYQFGAYVLCIDLLRSLFPDGEKHPPRLTDGGWQVWALAALANSYSHSGQPRRAVPLYDQASALVETQDRMRNIAVGLGNVAEERLKLGALRAAEVNLRRRIAMCEEIKDERLEAGSRQALGRLLAYRGAEAESETELAQALKIDEASSTTLGQGITWGYTALREILALRSASNAPIGGFNKLKALILKMGKPRSAVASACRALQLSDEWARTHFPVEHEYVRAHWLLGAAHCVAAQHEEAEHHLHEALERCRRINLVDHEADILTDLARLRAATGAADEAQRLAEEARLIAERCGYVLQAADAHLELAKLALARRDPATARDHAQQAKDFATCDGPPDYTYKAAYTEATSLLAQLHSE